MQGAEKEKLLPLLLPFCWQHGWLKVAKQTNHLTSHGSGHMIRVRGPGCDASAVRLQQPCGCLWCQEGPSHGTSPPLPRRRRTAGFFLLKYVTTETLPTSLIGPAIAHSEPSQIGSAGHSRIFEELSLSEAAPWHPPPTLQGSTQAMNNLPHREPIPHAINKTSLIASMNLVLGYYGVYWLSYPFFLKLWPFKSKVQDCTIFHLHIYTVTNYAIYAYIYLCFTCTVYALHLWFSIVGAIFFLKWTLGVREGRSNRNREKVRWLQNISKFFSARISTFSWQCGYC